LKGKVNVKIKWGGGAKYQYSEVDVVGHA